MPKPAQRASKKNTPQEGSPKAKHNPQLVPRISFPHKIVRDKSKSLPERVAALTFYYGGLVTEVYCRTRLDKKSARTTPCTCLYDAMLDPTTGQPSYLVQAVAEYVIERYWDGGRTGQLSSISAIIQESYKHSSSSSSSSVMHLRYPLPYKHSKDAQRQSPLNDNSEDDDSIINASQPRKHKNHRKQYLVCQSAIMNIFGIGEARWISCKKVADNGGHIEEFHLKGRAGNSRIKGATLEEVHAFFRSIAQEHGYHHPPRMDSSTGETGPEDAAIQGLEPPTIKLAVSGRTLYRRFCYEQGWLASTDHNGTFRYTERPNWPSDRPRRKKICWNAFLALRKEFYPFLIPAATKSGAPIELLEHLQTNNDNAALAEDHGNE